MREPGKTVEHVDLRGKAVNFCKGCLACQKFQRCVIHDAANEIVQKMGAAKVIVLAMPVYFYDMCGTQPTGAYFFREFSETTFSLNLLEKVLLDFFNIQLSAARYP